MDFVRTLEVALGWLELGLPGDSLRELETLSARDRMRKQALEMKMSAEMQAQLWNAGADTGRLLCLREPKEPRFFINAAFCLHETGDTLAARNWLMTGPSGLIDDPLFHYNLACYQAVLGEETQARVHLDKAIAMDEAFREMAERDEDLQCLREPKVR